MGNKYLATGNRYRPVAVVEVLRALHAISQKGEHPKALAQTIFGRLSHTARESVSRTADVVKIISWARGIERRTKAGNNPRDPLWRVEEIRKLIPLPVIHPKMAHRGPRTKKTPTRTATVAPGALPGLNLIVVTKSGITKIEVETDEVTGRRILAAIAQEQGYGR